MDKENARVRTLLFNSINAATLTKDTSTIIVSHPHIMRPTILSRAMMMQWTLSTHDALSR